MTILQVGPDAPIWAREGARAILILHITGGSLGIASGTVALLARKGETLHRVAGTVFFVSMLIAYTIATCVAPFLDDGQRPNLCCRTVGLVSAHQRVGDRQARGRNRRPFRSFRTCAGPPHYGDGSALHSHGGRQPDGHDRWFAAASVLRLRFRRIVCRRRGSQRNFAARHHGRSAHRTASLAHVLRAVHRHRLVLPRTAENHAPNGCTDRRFFFALALAPSGFMVFWLIRVRLTNWYKNHGIAA